MLPTVAFVLCGIPSVLAWWQETPEDGDAIPTDAFTVGWGYDPDEFSDMIFTIQMEFMPTESAPVTTLTTEVDALMSSTVLPPSFLPAMRPGETSPIALVIYELWDSATYGVVISDLSLVGPTPQTATVTVTSSEVRTVTAASAAPTLDLGAETALSTPTAAGDLDGEQEEESEEEKRHGGLSTGAKAGIGVGVSAGVLLLVAAGGFYFLRRRRHSNSVNTIATPELETRERPISELESKSQNLPVIASPVSERRSDERHELSG